MQARDTCIQLILAKNKNHKTYLQAVIKGGAQDLMASLVAQMVKKLPATQKTRVRSLGWEDPLEKGMATHSSILAWRIPWAEEPSGLQSTEKGMATHCSILAWRIPWAEEPSGLQLDTTDQLTHTHKQDYKHCMYYIIQFSQQSYEATIITPFYRREN